MDLAPGTRIGSYHIDQLLGRGGMGEVYLATDTRLQRPVALKLLPADLSADPDRRARFEREAKMAAALRHPHICTIHEVGESDGRPFIAMEYIEGTTLADRIAVDLFSVKETLDIAIQIADALEEARIQHVVHRDLKSANIILTPRGDVKILDFGLAKRIDEPGAREATTAAAVTDAGLVIGTAAYMSPEQALGQAVDHRSDLFSFGVVLYELLTGRLPFSGRTSMELFSAILHSAPAPIPRFNEGVPDALVRVVSKLLEKDREQRYQSAREVVTDLRKIRNEGSTASVGIPVAARRIRRSWVAAAGLVLVGATALALWINSHGAFSDNLVGVVVVPATILGSPRSAYLADAIPQTTSTDLAQVAGLDVKRPPTTIEVEPFHGDIKRVVAAYGVRYYVQPIVYADGGRLKLTLQIIDRETNRLMPGSREFEGNEDTYLSMIHAAAEGISLALRPGAAKFETPAGQTHSSEAELALRAGQYFSNRYNNEHKPEDFEKASTSLRRAFEVDPKLAAAAAEIAMLHIFKYELSSSETILAEADRWAGIATTLDPLDSLAWAAVSGIENYRPHRRPDVQLSAALRSAANGPRSALAHQSLSMALDSLTLRVVASKQSIRVNPLYAMGMVNVGVSLQDLGESAEALGHFDAALAIEPGLPWALYGQVLALASLGKADEADRVLETLRPAVAAGREPEIELRIADYAVAVARRDATRTAVAQRALLALLSKPESPAIWGISRIGDLIRQGQTDTALRLMTRAAAEGPGMLFDELMLNPAYAALQRDARFAKVFELARARFQALLALLDASRARGELPAYLEQPLKDLRAKLKM